LKCQFLLRRAEEIGLITFGEVVMRGMMRERDKKDAKETINTTLQMAARDRRWEANGGKEPEFEEYLDQFDWIEDPMERSKKMEACGYLQAIKKPRLERTAQLNKQKSLSTLLQVKKKHEEKERLKREEEKRKNDEAKKDEDRPFLSWDYKEEDQNDNFIIQKDSATAEIDIKQLFMQEGRKKVLSERKNDVKKKTYRSLRYRRLPYNR